MKDNYRKTTRHRKTRKKGGKRQRGGELETVRAARRLTRRIKDKILHPLRPPWAFTDTFVKLLVEAISKALAIYLNFLHKLAPEIIVQDGGGIGSMFAEPQLRAINSLDERIRAGGAQLQDEWTEVSKRIITVLFEPILSQAILLAEREADAIGGAVGKMVHRVISRIIMGLWDGVEAGISVVPGLGSIVDILSILQTILDSVAHISIQSIIVITKVITSSLEILEVSIEPIGEVDRMVADVLKKFTPPAPGGVEDVEYDDPDA